MEKIHSFVIYELDELYRESPEKISKKSILWLINDYGLEVTMMYHPCQALSFILQKIGFKNIFEKVTKFVLRFPGIQRLIIYQTYMDEATHEIERLKQ